LEVKLHEMERDRMRQPMLTLLGRIDMIGALKIGSVPSI